jgi:hypothetical protein
MEEKAEEFAQDAAQCQYGGNHFRLAQSEEGVLRNR